MRLHPWVGVLAGPRRVTTSHAAEPYSPPLRLAPPDAGNRHALAQESGEVAEPALPSFAEFLLLFDAPNSQSPS
jgi:hypothetical protein